MKTETYDAYKYLSEHYTLLVDTREKQNWRYQRRMEAFEELGVHTLRQKLGVGDYSAILELPNGTTLDFSSKIVCERKGQLEELMTCYGTDRERFKAELIRAKNMGCKIFVVTESGSYEDIITGNYKNEISPIIAKATYHTFEQRYDAHFVFVRPASFPVFVYDTLRRYIMDYLCKTYPNGEIL